MSEGASELGLVAEAPAEGQFADGLVAVRVAQLAVDCLHMHYKHHFKTSKGFSGKNVELFLGNFVSLLARERAGAGKAFASLQSWVCWPVIKDHYANKGMTERDIYKHIQKLLAERTVKSAR